jgi:hypothetical protein
MKDNAPIKTLREWMVEKKISQRQMAKLMDTKQQNINRWLGAATPELTVMRQIKTLTRNEVDYEAFLPWEKYAGDKRLVDAGLVPPQTLNRWEVLAPKLEQAPRD